MVWQFIVTSMNLLLVAKMVLMIDKKKHLLSSETISNYEKIIELLKKNNSGLTIAEISKLLKIARNTASIHLAKLEGAKQITIRKVGMAKIYSLKPELQTKLTIKEAD